jgi:hypothetical protein
MTHLEFDPFLVHKLRDLLRILQRDYHGFLAENSQVVFDRELKHFHVESIRSGNKNRIQMLFFDHPPEISVRIRGVPLARGLGQALDRIADGNDLRPLVLRQNRQMVLALSSETNDAYLCSFRQLGST